MRIKKPVIVLLVCLLGCTTARISETTCKKCEKGNFIQYAYNNSGLGHWKKLTFLINRTDSTEIVINTANILPADTCYYKIKWLNSCSYEATYIAGAGEWVDSLIRNKKYPAPQKYSIIKGTDKYYIQRQDEQNDTIWIH
jgi:hypothetical protein